MCITNPKSGTESSSNTNTHTTSSPRPTVNNKASKQTKPHVPTRHQQRETDHGVFLSGALHRAAQQPWDRRWSTLRTIACVILNDIWWWLRHGLWYIPSTLQNSRLKYNVPLQLGLQTPSIDVYAVPCDRDALIPLMKRRVPCNTTTPNSQDEQVEHEQQARVQRPVVLYVHGGAWGGGSALSCANLATSVMRRTNLSVAVLDYRLHPIGTMAQQADDVTAALQSLRDRIGRDARLYVMAHSSGAHIAAMACLRRAQMGLKPLADLMILSCAPLHLGHHFLYESRRGVAHVSPMLPAAGAHVDIARFDDVSPSLIAESMQVDLSEMNDSKTPVFLEGDIAASNIPLPISAPRRVEDGNVKGVKFPHIFLQASTSDGVVPVYSSIRFASALRKRGLSPRLLVYDGCKHVEFVTDWFDNPAEADRCHVLDVNDKDANRRVDCIRHMFGREAVQLFNEREMSRASSPHVRDVLRIVEKFSSASPE